MVVSLSGRIKMDRTTKLLCKRLRPGDIALIAHQNLDELAAQELAEKGVKAVINAYNIFNGEYPAMGAGCLLEKGIFVLDNVGEDIFAKVSEKEVVSIVGNNIFCCGEMLGRGRIVGKKMLQKSLSRAEQNLKRQLDLFVQNTLEYARKEKDLILNKLEMPEIKTNFCGKHVVVAVRGKSYKKDLMAIRAYIKEIRPVLVGVDGGGDALCALGFKPDIIIGDMDSVDDLTLKKAGEIIVHAYPDGRAPGLKRIESLGLEAKVIPSPGTSEDLALLLAYDRKAELIVAVGTHSHMLDFLEKGRRGMASTFLVRLKVGDKLVDAKGLAHLYQGGVKLRHLSMLIAAAAFPVIVLAVLSPLVRHFFYLLSWRFGLR